MGERGRLFGGAAIAEGFNQAFRYKEPSFSASWLVFFFLVFILKNTGP
mgnify:FL=1